MRFKPGWPMTLLVVVFLPLTLSLGGWQLNRANEKTQQLADYEREQQRSPIVWQGYDSHAAGTILEFCAQLDGSLWFLDNRTQGGQVGYDVFAPARLCATNASVILRLGFVAAPAQRTELPLLASPEGEWDLVVEVRPVPPEPMLTAAAEDMGGQRWRIQSFRQLPSDNGFDASTLIGQVLQPAALRLSDQWSPVTMPPDRHLGYAIQWFGLALVLSIGFLIWGVHRASELTRGNDEQHGQ
ncbi:SURF1 family protein [Salinispirillum marinum]|uniref:SURF1-like protein n=2 Tax=Saccharospirillaceae TaxID=255527 RepID=A0ABV8BBZ6_9GAMM